MYLLSGTTKDTWPHAGARTADRELKACAVLRLTNGTVPPKEPVGDVASVPRTKDESFALKHVQASALAHAH